MSPFRRAVSAMCVVAAALCAGPVHAASGVVASSGGGFRCIDAYAVVPTGTAWLDVCFDEGPSVADPIGSAPSAAITWIQGMMSVNTARGSDLRLFGFDPLDPQNPKPQLLTALSMDPAMQSATLSLQVSTITANITLTGTLAPPIAYDGAFANEFIDQMTTDGSPRLCAFAEGGVGVAREAAVTGSIRSSTKGGGALSDGGAEMREGTGAGGLVTASPASPGDCRFS